MNKEQPLIEAQARDFSILGIGMTMSGRHKEAIVMKQEVDLIFKLPNSNEPIDLGAVVRHLGQAGNQVSVGVEILSDPRFTVEARKHLRDYVMRRQLEMRRKGVRRD